MVYNYSRENLHMELRSDELKDIKDAISKLAEAQLKSEEEIRKLGTSMSKLEETVVKLAEAQRRTEERLNELAEVQKRSEERLTKLEETVVKLAEAQRRTEERLNELAEVQKRSEERLTKLEETVVKLAEAQRRTEESLDELARVVANLSTKVESLNKTVSSIGQRWGVDYEELIRAFFQDFAKREGLDFTYLDKFTYKDEEGKYGKKGKVYEMDILAKNDKLYLIEIKSFVEEDDIEWFDTKSDIIIKVLNARNPVKLILGVNVTDDAVKAAEGLGIKLVYGNVIEVKRKEKK
ncbi:hypothetical protein HS7_03480 [Sulfolobales archaeon HS-7]|nr:hypothetical protein HS7_03480 [Sulfolobales archaeon HS-7]